MFLLLAPLPAATCRRAGNRPQAAVSPCRDGEPASENRPLSPAGRRADGFVPCASTKPEPREPPPRPEPVDGGPLRATSRAQRGWKTAVAPSEQAVKAGAQTALEPACSSVHSALLQHSARRSPHQAPPPADPPVAATRPHLPQVHQDGRAPEPGRPPSHQTAGRRESKAAQHRRANAPGGQPPENIPGSHLPPARGCHSARPTITPSHMRQLALTVGQLQQDRH